MTDESTHRRDRLTTTPFEQLQPHPGAAAQPAPPAPSAPSAYGQVGHGHTPFAQQHRSGSTGPAPGGPPPGYGPPVTGWGAPPERSPSMLGALFDLSYDRYATPSVARVVQVVVMVVTGLNVVTIPFLLAFGGGDSAPGPAIAFLAFLAGVVVWFLVNVMVRVGLELAVAGIKTAENTEELVRLAREQRRG